MSVGPSFGNVFADVSLPMKSQVKYSGSGTDAGADL